MQKDNNPELTNYEDVARHYLVNYAPQEEAWEEWLVSQSPTLAQAIELASPGAGPLTCYDIAQRIGVWLKEEPTEVYLHAGTREGAKAVLGTLANQDRMPMNDFPEGLRRSLTAAQLEDVLCIYRGTLARIAGNGQIETTSHSITRCPAQPRTSRPGGCRKT